MSGTTVRWIDPPDRHDGRCPLCANAAGNTILLEARSAFGSGVWCRLVSCAACGSAWYPDGADVSTEVAYPSRTSDGASPDSMFRLQAYHYLELVNGLDWKLELLDRVDTAGVGSMLEVGCHLGALVHYARVHGVEAIGLEPSAFGRLGSELYGVSILAASTYDAIELEGRTFDLVVSTEVIEHVDDPLDFLRELRRLTASGGVAVVTTPRAEAIATETSDGELDAILSVGLHRCVLSAAQLAAMATAAGFASVDVVPFGISHAAVFSDAPVTPSALQAPVPIRLERYWEGFDVDAPADDRVVLAARMHRMVQRRLRRPGEWDELDYELAATVAEGLADVFDVDLDQPDQLIERVTAAQSSLALGRVIPYHLPQYVRWLAHDPNLSEAQRDLHWRTALTLAQHGVSVDRQNLWTYDLVISDVSAILESRRRATPAAARRRQPRHLLAAARRRLSLR